MPGPKQGMPVVLAGPPASQARHHHKTVGPAQGAPADPATTQSRQRHRPDGTAAVLPGTCAGRAAAAGRCERERGGRLCSDAGPSSAAVATSQQQERGARVAGSIPAAAISGAGSPADQDIRNRVGLFRGASGRTENRAARLAPNGLAPAAAMAMASPPPSKDPTSAAPAAAGTSQLPTGAARLHGDGSAQPAAAPVTPGQSAKRPLQQLLVSPRRRMSVKDRANQLRRQGSDPEAGQEAAAAAALQAAAEAAGLRPPATGPSAQSGQPDAGNAAAARTAATTPAHTAAQAPAVAAPAEATPAAATPARPRPSKRKAPSLDSRPATQQEPNLLSTSPAATSTMPARTPRAADAASEQAPAVEQDTVPRTRQKRGHVGTAAVESGQDSLQSGQHLVTPATWPGLHAAAQAGKASTCRPGNPRAGSGVAVPAQQEQQASRRDSAKASGSGRVMAAKSKQATGRGLLSSGLKASAPAPGTRGTTTDDDCIDLSKLVTPASRLPRVSASDSATNDVVIDLT